MSTPPANDHVWAIAWSREGIAVAWLHPDGRVEHARWYYGFQWVRAEPS